MEVRCELSVILAQKDMQLKELADKTGLNYKHLSKIKNNNNLPNISTALIIAEALNVNVEEIWRVKK